VAVSVSKFVLHSHYYSIWLVATFSIMLFFKPASLKIEFHMLILNQSERNCNDDLMGELNEWVSIVLPPLQYISKIHFLSSLYN
jgi:hypothetical protein